MNYVSWKTLYPLNYLPSSIYVLFSIYLFYVYVSVYVCLCVHVNVGVCRLEINKDVLVFIWKFVEFNSLHHVYFRDQT